MSPRQLHPDVRRLRTLFWLRGLLTRLRMKTVIELGQFIERDARERTGTSRDKKWRDFDRVGRSPRTWLVALAETRSHRSPCDGQVVSGAGSRAEFDHVLWEVLGTLDAEAVLVRQWIDRLSPKVRALMLSALGRRAERGRFIAPIPTHRELNQLELLAGLDALAAMTIIVRQAHLVRRHNVAHESGQSLCKMLWMLAPMFVDRGVCEQLFEAYEWLVLPLTARRLFGDGGYRLRLEQHGLLARVGWLHAQAYPNGSTAWRALPNRDWALRVRSTMRDHGFLDYYSDRTIDRDEVNKVYSAGA